MLDVSSPSNDLQQVRPLRGINPPAFTSGHSGRHVEVLSQTEDHKSSHAIDKADVLTA